MTSTITENEVKGRILVEDRGGYAVLTINRPDKRNSMDRAARTRLREALAEVYDKKVVVLTGNGDAFCSGMDLVEMKDHPPTEERQGSQQLTSWPLCMDDIWRHPAVFIAAVNGYALGGGSTLINVCELAIAAESAQIGVPEMGFGAWPRQAGPALIKRVLPKHAAELIFMAKRVDAATAYRMGMVNEVVPDAELLPRACAVAEHISAFDGTMLDWGKKAFHRIEELGWDDAWDLSTYTTDAIKANRGDSYAGVARFAAGERGPGQGR